VIFSEALNSKYVETFPPLNGGRSSATRRKIEATLCAVLMVALADFAFGSEPVFGFVARLESAALRH
jgi:5-carboxymethyl-2-hydroxymuconate isomerase